MTSEKHVYGPDDLASFDAESALGQPGEYPFTRGIYRDMYRSRGWTMRQYAGFGNARETNKRFRYLLSNGQTGLSTAFDLPTQMGYDSDDPLALGEVGKTGVAIDSLADMEILFDQIDLGKVSTSMTINATSAVLLAMYRAVGKKQGVDSKLLQGTIQNDILKEYEARNTYIYPPAQSMRLITDIFAFSAAHVPRWNTISVSGYHIREAGATAAQELAFTLRDGIEYVQAGVDAGLDVDAFVPRVSFFFNAHSDFFEEIAKYRAARRIWARVMRERFGAKDERSLKLRFHAQTAGVSLTAQQPMNNVMRTALQALSAVLGGTNSLHTNSLDEALALPTAEAATLALRTQQILAYETGITRSVDPFGGSYFVERLTRDLEAEADEYFRRIDAMGGMIAAIERGFPQREIAEAAYRFQQDVERKRQVIVGVNEFASEREVGVPILQIDEAAAEQQAAKADRLRRTRNKVVVARALDRLRKAASGTENTMPALLDAVRAYATIGEMCDALRDVWGEYQEQAII